jgi:PAS domain S-box-containing protein
MAAACTPGGLLDSLQEEVVWEADAATEEFLFVSAAAEPLFGFPMAEWRTDRASLCSAHVHPDDRERCRRACLDATRAGRDHEVEFRMVRADGSLVWVRDRIYLVRDAGGAVVALRGIMTDITERHRAESALRDSEDRLRLALEAGQLGTWDFTPATGEMLCSERCYELLSLAPGTRVTYESFLARIHPDDRARVRERGQLILGGGGDELCEIEYRLDMDDGSERWLASHGRIHRDASGLPTRIVGTMADITDRVRSQRDQEELLAELTAEKLRAEEASRAKDEFLAMLGHELRNPLAPIQTALEVMALREADGPSREELIIRRQVSHLVQLLDDLLDVSRLAGGQFELDLRALDLADVVGHAVEVTSPLLEQRRHHLSVDVPRGALRMAGDERRLIQVVAHLLDNAARYTEPGGAVAVRASRAGERAVLEVVDSGVGLAPDLLPRVFDLFVQAERAPDRAEGGLGIGLSLVRTFVRMHGGEVAARNNRAGGSTFQVVLPLLADGGQADWPRARADSPTGAGRRDRQSAILVVDDNQDAADLLAEVLRDQGHQVQVAHDGPQALERVSEFRPEVAILDIGLPVMDGYELALALRNRLGPELRLLAVTGYGQERDRARSHEVGFEKHFVKPVALTDLLDAIEVDGEAAS